MTAKIFQGLTSEEAKKRLEKYGKNKIRRFKKISAIKIFLSQFTSPLIIILIVAALLSWLIGFFPGQESNVIDTVLILSIVFISGIAGFFQEYKSEKTIEMLQEMSVPTTRVIREGKEIEISVEDVVPGDLVLLEAGDVIPADAKLVECFDLRVDESILTGESREVNKKISDMVFMNTFVRAGNGKAIVEKIGMQTKLGEIAEKLQTIKEEKTPFQKEISKFSKKVSWAIIILIFIIVLVSSFKYSFYLSFLLAVSLAVAAIPEGLPAVIILTLSISAKSILKKNALIRKLNVIESLGSVDVICTDKTGTITKNEMEVTKLFFDNGVLEISDIDKEKLKQILICGALCNNSSVGYDKEGNKKYLGDQTEVALRKLSEKFGIVKEKLDDFSRIGEVGFTSKRKMMSVIYEHKNKRFVYSKGAPEILIQKCSRIYEGNRIRKIKKSDIEKILKQNEKFASEALRVLGFAFKEIHDKGSLGEGEGLEENLVWLGLAAMIDPPREEVKDALEKCKSAGIRVIMLTGDNPLTAKSIAEQVGLESKGFLEGKDLDKMIDEDLEKKLKEGVNIFARISPFHKLKILEILKKEYRVAMTGDGVNDSLALKKADVGIAMGIRGTDVAKEASDIVLLDDNFATIVETIKEGRKIFDNIQKFINYLFVCNFAEVAVIFFATLFLTLKEPLLFPAHLLWINLLTDGLPALALGADPPREDILRNPPRKKDKGIIDKRLSWLIILIGIENTIMLFGLFFLTLPFGMGVARTTLFTGFIFYEFVRIASIRTQEKLDWLSNKFLLLTLALSLILQFIIVYSPLNQFFKIVPLNLYSITIILIGTSISYFVSVFTTKLVMRYIRE